jgi:hypothetical protein
MVRRFSAGAVLLLLAAAAPAAAQTTLQLKFKQGDKFYMEEVNTVRQTIDYMGKQTSTIETTTVYGFTVQKADKDGTVLQQKIESMKVKTDGSGQTADMDKMGPLFKGTTFTITLDPSGRVTKFEGYEDMIKKLGEGREMMARMLKSILNEEFMKQSAAQAFGYLPTNPVNEGDTWRREWFVPLGPLGTFKAEHTYKYEGHTDEGEKITFNSRMTYQPPKPDNQLPAFKIVKGDLTAENAKGTMLFDNKAGRLVRQQMDMGIKGTMTIDVLGKEETMALDQKQTSTIKVTEKNPEK